MALNSVLAAYRRLDPFEIGSVIEYKERDPLKPF